ncbi:hypothetical protein VUR80DRAFT_4486 [Thermomyces stellatus]
MMTSMATIIANIRPTPRYCRDTDSIASPPSVVVFVAYSLAPHTALPYLPSARCGFPSTHPQARVDVGSALRDAVPGTQSAHLQGPDLGTLGPRGHDRFRGAGLQQFRVTRLGWSLVEGKDRCVDAQSLDGRPFRSFPLHRWPGIRDGRLHGAP